MFLSALATVHTIQKYLLPFVVLQGGLSSDHMSHFLFDEEFGVVVVYHHGFEEKSDSDTCFAYTFCDDLYLS